MKLYSDAIEKLYNNPNAPQIFREIFKNSFLPFKDPSTLKMFLKEINEFHYSNSEDLGDAYEYLLSFMGSQGDAGQFRTPRAGFEPATNRLTVDRSTAELPRNI